MKKCNKTKNPCKICLQTVTNKNGLQCEGACKKWVHFTCLNYTPGKIKDIKAGAIKISCPCPDCKKNNNENNEVQTSIPYSCTNIQCPANTPPKCENVQCPANESGGPKMIPDNYRELLGIGPQLLVPPLNSGQVPHLKTPHPTMTGGCGPSETHLRQPKNIQTSNDKFGGCTLNKCTQKNCHSNPSIPILCPQPQAPITQPHTPYLQAPDAQSKCNQKQQPKVPSKGKGIKITTGGCNAGQITSGDLQYNDHSLATVEQMCNTVGQLTNQINELMKKLKSVAKQKAGRGESKIEMKYEGDHPQLRNESTEKPCYCPGNPLVKKPF